MDQPRSIIITAHSPSSGSPPNPDRTPDPNQDPRIRVVQLGPVGRFFASLFSILITIALLAAVVAGLVLFAAIAIPIAIALALLALAVYFYFIIRLRLALRSNAASPDSQAQSPADGRQNVRVRHADSSPPSDVPGDIL